LTTKFKQNCLVFTVEREVKTNFAIKTSSGSKMLIYLFFFEESPKSLNTGGIATYQQ